MAFQRIRIKNTNVSGKIPGADKLDTAELCINLKDQKLYSKDADGNVFELGGGKVESGPTPPSNGNEIGDLWWDGNFLLVWNGSEWVAVGVSDLDYEAAADKGTITNTNGDGAEIPLVDDTNAGLMSPEDFKKLGDMPAVISGPNQPGNPSLGDIWIDTSDCPPTINVWDDCENPGNPIWTPIGGGGTGGCVQGPVSIVSSNGNEINSTLTAVGGNGTDEGTGLTATYEWTGAKTGTGATIVADVEGDYTVTARITCGDSSVLGTTATWTVADAYEDMINNTPPLIAVVGGGVDEAYEGNSIYVVTPATVLNGENPVIVENQWFKDAAADGISQIYTIGSDDEGAVITCKQLFRDARTNELLSEASNGITIVARPADAIGFTPVINDDNTATGNQVGKTLTAAALNITGGVAAQEYAFQWYADGVPEIGAQNKTKVIIKSDVGKTITCDITVAEPDGTNPETRTAIYNKTIEVAGTINTPSVLEPQDGAGSGAQRYLKSDTIIEVEGGGITTCETDLIQSVDSQIADYSSSLTCVQGFGAPASNAFNGKTVTSGDGNYSGGTTCFPRGEATWQWNKEINFSKLKIYAACHQDAGGSSAYGFVKVKNSTTDWIEIKGFLGENDDFNLNAPGLDTGVDVTNQVSELNGKIDAVQFTANGSQGWGLWGIEIDGYLLVDGNTETTLTFPDSTGFSCFELGDVVQDPDVKIISKNEAANIIAVNGGNWKGTDGTGDQADGEDKLVKETPYDTKLTVDGSTDLADMTGSVLMTDGTGAPGPYSQTPYKLVTSDIKTVVGAPPTIYEAYWVGDVQGGEFSFDGNLIATYTFPSQDDGVCTWAPAKAINFNTLTIYASLSGTGGSMSVNGTPITNELQDYDGVNAFSVDNAKLAELGVTSPLTEIKIVSSPTYGNTPVLCGVVINGQTLVSDPDGTDNIKLLFSEDVSTNPDLQYFAPGDLVQGFDISSEAFPTSPTGSSSLVKFDQVNPIDGVTGETWSPVSVDGAGDVPEPVTDPNAPEVWGLTESIDLSKGGHFYTKGSLFNIGQGGALTIWAYFENDGIEATIYKGNTTGGLQWGIENGSHGVLATSSTIAPGGDNTPIGTFGTFPAGYHRVSLYVEPGEGINNKVRCEIDGVQFGTDFAISGGINFDYIGGDARVVGGDSGINIFAMQVVTIQDALAPVYVVETDLTENSMVVDGGKWSGTDGSGEVDGDTIVEYQTKGGQGDVISVNTDDNTILLTDTGNRDNRWMGENKAATDFYVAGPSIVDAPLLTADVELKSTDFATTPENVDTLKNIVWELNNVEQNAGVSNPYKPTLNTNTTYIVRVKHQGNDLEDSAWSTATTFTTGATRNLYTYYKERVELLESRLASIEADEVNDDATDTVLINTVANLLERIEQLEGGA